MQDALSFRRARRLRALRAHKVRRSRAARPGERIVLHDATMRGGGATHEIWRKSRVRIASLSALGTPTIRRVKPVWQMRRFSCCCIHRQEAPAQAERRARTGVDVDGLPARDGVHAHDGVDGLDGLAADGVAGGARTVCLGDRAVHGGQALEVLLEAGAEGGVEGVANAAQSAHVSPRSRKRTKVCVRKLTRSSKGCRRRKGGR